MADAPVDSRPAASFNEAQQRHLLASCQYIDQVLAEALAMLTAAASPSPFTRYAADTTPAQRKVIQDYVEDLRRQLVRVLASVGLSPAPSRVGTIGAIRTHLRFISIAIEELKPRHMRGYGELPQATAREVEGIVEELHASLRRFDAYLAQGLAADLQARVSRLTPDAQTELLGRLERIIDRHSLVEFRPALTMILDRLEDQRFEIAVFGRVSTGKSSLLNRLLDTDVLPVGVNPITSIPTRVVYGPDPLVRVSVAARAPEIVRIDRLAEYVTEAGNPGNTRRVTRVVVEIPAPVLEQGVVFVDTPGLGSLATSGAAETLAYLPRCDLGIVLIDATSTLSPEDVGTARTLIEAAIPAVVLVSKADLLTETDRTRVVEYVANQLRDQLGLDVRVSPVSVRPDHLALVERWVADEIRPLIERHRDLTHESIGRKIAGLRYAVAAVLRGHVDHVSRPARAAPVLEMSATDSELRAMATTFAETRAVCHEIVSQLPELAEPTIARVAERLLEIRLAGPRVSPDAVTAALARSVDDRAGPLVAEIRARLQRLARTAREASVRLETAPGADPVSEAAWESLVVEAPRPDVGALALDVGAPTRVLGRRLAHASLVRALRRAIGERVFHALSSYATVLRSWTTATVDRLQEEFDAKAVALRANSVTTADRRSPDDRDAVLADLEALESVATGEVTSGHGT